MTELWTSQDAVEATGGSTTKDWVAQGVSIDTRSLVPGDLFVALTDVRDGHDFVAAALEKGAAAALVSRVPEGVPVDAPLLIVDDVLDGLGRLGMAARARTGAKIAAVTGSVGKTSTKEMLRAILSGQGRVHAAEASYNNHWGVPLTLARMPQDTEFGIFEIGMSNPGEIAPLSKMVQPDIALITTVQPVHLAAFEDVAGIAREKATIFEGLKPGGCAVINADLDVTPILQEAAGAVGAKIVAFGKGPSADCILRDVTITDSTTIVEAGFGETDLLFKLMAPGRHLAMNAVAAMAVTQGLGCDLTVATCDIANWSPPAGRGMKEVLVMDLVEDHLVFTLIDDAFNANPASLQAGLEVLAASVPQNDVGRVASGRRVAVLGDMLELGGQEVSMHKSVAQMSGFDEIDIVHCVGPLMKHLYDLMPAHQRGVWCETAQEMVEQAHRIVDAGDVILVKGSKGIKVSLVVDAIRKLGHPQVLSKIGAD
ncbi:MAG: UDP-N-acetylmuramoyl-tripeptide--D-alanyl-D-alanine ligase [Marinosulfonomonas sp.]